MYWMCVVLFQLHYFYDFIDSDCTAGWIVLKITCNYWFVKAWLSICDVSWCGWCEGTVPAAVGCNIYHCRLIMKMIWGGIQVFAVWVTYPDVVFFHSVTALCSVNVMQKLQGSECRRQPSSVSYQMSLVMWGSVKVWGCTVFGSLTAVTTHFNTFVLTFCNWFWWIRVRPCGWQFSFAICFAVAQFTLSSVKLCLSFSEVDCFHAAWNETFIQ